MRPDNTGYLRAAEQHRRTRLLDAANSALRRLDLENKPITVAALVRASGVSRAFVYRQSGLITEIQRLRDRQTPSGPPVPARQRATDASLQARIRQLTAANAELRAENTRLRDQNGLLLGRLREHAATTPTSPLTRQE